MRPYFMSVFNWLGFLDYDLEKQNATVRIVNRQSRGSISAQNGWSMNRPQLIDQSRKADEDMAYLERTIPTNQ